MASDWRPPLTQLAREDAAYARLRVKATRWTDLYLDLATTTLKCDEEEIRELMLEDRLHPYMILPLMFEDGRSQDATRIAFLSHYDKGKAVDIEDRYEGLVVSYMMSIERLWRKLVGGEEVYPLHILLRALPIHEALIRYFCFYYATEYFWSRQLGPNIPVTNLRYPGTEGDLSELRAFDRASMDAYGLDRLLDEMNKVAPWGSNEEDYRILRDRLDKLDRYSYLRYVIRETMTLPSRAKSARSVAAH